MLWSSGEPVIRASTVLQFLKTPDFDNDHTLSPRDVSPPGGYSKAVLWLGQLRLSCSEDQLLVLVGLLSHSLAFGPMSSWGADVFIEIGVLAGTGGEIVR